MKKVIYYLDVTFLFVLFLVPALLLIFIHPLFSHAAIVLDEEGYYDIYRHNATSYFQCYYYKDGFHHTLRFDSFDKAFLPENSNVTFDGTTYIINTGLNSNSFDVYDYRYNNPSSWDDISSSTSRASYLSLNINTGVLSLYHYQAGGSANGYHESEPYMTITVSNEQLHGIVTNYFEFAGFAEPELSVRFVPYALSGDIKEEMEVDGSLWKSYAIQMIIDNPTSKNYQYFWCIVPKGERPSFSGIKDLNSYNGRAFSGSIQWVHIKESWAYILNPDIINATLDSTTEDTSDLNLSVYQNTLLPSSWQFIGSGTTKTESAFYSNMKLFSGQEYECLVYVLETNCEHLSFISKEFTDGYLDEYLGNKAVDFRNAELLYSSTFKMCFTTDFDPDFNAVGVISYDPDSNSNSIFNRSSARYNPDTNALEIGYNLGNYRNNPTSYSFSGSANKSNLNTFSGAFSNVFSFVSAFFSYLPGSYQQMYFFGLTALVVLAILKAVK